MKDIITDVLILGAGPAGLSAAIYAARAGKKTVVLKGKAPSRLEWAHKVENYPGLDGMTGKDMLATFEAQAVKFGAQIEESDALELALDMNPKMVTTRHSFIVASTIILAMGRGEHKKAVANEDEYVGLGVSYCATCDGTFFKGKPVVVYGSDHEALDDSIMLRDLGCDVTLISSAMSEMSPIPDGIKYLPKTHVLSVEGAGMVSAIKIKNADGETILETRALFIIQAMPSGALLRKTTLDISDKDCIQVDRKMHTSIAGVFAAGDMTCGGLQVSVAVGEGATAALEALKYLREQASPL